MYITLNNIKTYDQQHIIFIGADNMARNNNNNQLVVNGAEQALEQMKYEIASEFGVTLGADTTSRANGSVGGEITKRLVQMAEQQLGGRTR
jgi:hypothetical protein